MKSKPSDESVLAVAENNIVGINQTHDLFDSFKKLKHATSETMNQKLTSIQKKVIGVNRCLVLMHMNKVKIKLNNKLGPTKIVATIKIFSITTKAHLKCS